SAVVAISRVAVAVVDATIKADMQAPEPMMEAVPPAVEGPVTRCPECAHIGWLYPGSRNPVIAFGRPRPVSRRPDVVRVGRWRLFVVRQWRRRLCGLFIG